MTSSSFQQESVRLQETEKLTEQMRLRPPPRRPMPIAEKIKPVLIPEPTIPPEVKEPPVLPPREALSIPTDKAEEKKKEETWWSNTYANAPENLKKIIVPKARILQRTKPVEKQELVVQTPGTGQKRFTRTSL